MTAKDLKNAILQEAVQGKLVPQIVSEGNAKDLLEQIKAEKAKLVKEGKIKKEKSLPEITEDEIPFDIPENWCWCRLGEVVKNVNYGTSAKSHPSGKVPVLRMGNITKDGNLSFENLVYTSDEKEIETYKLFPGDMLFNRTNSAEWVGKTTVYKGERPAIFAGYIIRYTPILIDSEYMNVVMNTSYQKKWCNEVKTNGVQQCNINAQNLLKFILPLPPLSEQKRIVAAIEQFMPMIEEYGKKESVLKDLNASIGTLTKKAILQEAVQGKLVPQIPTEGNAKDLLEQIKAQKAQLIKEGKIKKDKPLPEITEEEIPFDIPENWCWCRLSQFCWLDNGIKVFGEKLPCLEAKYLRGKISATYLNSGVVVTPSMCVILVDGENSGEVFSVPEKGYMGSTFKILNVSSVMYDKYVQMLLLCYKDLFRNNKKGAAIPHLNKDIFKNLIVGIPPLSEQKRIVEAIEKLLPYCEKLGRE